jgi:hypothetical protein
MVDINRKGLDQNDFIEIKDIAVAAYLYSTSSLSFIGKRRLTTGDVLFQFSPKNKAKELINSYWNLSASPIQPKLLFSAQRDLKDMIFAG